MCQELSAALMFPWVVVSVTPCIVVLDEAGCMTSHTEPVEEQRFRGGLPSAQSAPASAVVPFGHLGQVGGHE